VVIGVGNRSRGDDAVGVIAAERLTRRCPGIEVVVHAGDVLGLCDVWIGADSAIVVDAMASAEAPGTIRRYDVDRSPLPQQALRGSTHAFGVNEAVRLARAVGALPRRLVVYGIVGSCFEVGRELSPAVERAADLVVARIEAEVGWIPAAGDGDA
jgi:hydrogenase maturation protease